MEFASADLAACEGVIERGLATFVEVGEALLRIRDGRLYRGAHGSFEEYCRDRWDMDRVHAHRHIQAAEITDVLSKDNIAPAPPNLRVARELAPLRSEPEQLREAWADAVEQHGPKPTAKQVREIVTERKPEGPAVQTVEAYAPRRPERTHGPGTRRDMGSATPRRDHEHPRRLHRLRRAVPRRGRRQLRRRRASGDGGMSVPARIDPALTPAAFDGARGAGS